MKDKLLEDFLYNTLNTIYAVNIEGEKKANELLLTFSEFIRFKDQKKSLRRISVSEECEYLAKYLFIEKSRKEKLQYALNFNTCKTRQIPPFFVIDCVNFLSKYFLISNEHFIDITIQCNSNVEISIKTAPIRFDKHEFSQKINRIIQSKIEFDCHVDFHETKQYFLLNLHTIN